MIPALKCGVPSKSFTFAGAENALHFLAFAAFFHKFTANNDGNAKKLATDYIITAVHKLAFNSFGGRADTTLDELLKVEVLKGKAK